SVQGSYEETFELSKQAIDKWGWYNRNAAINPYLSEGKKTVALEIMEQLNWEVPDYIAISVGDGCTIAGLWKGLKDLHAIGFIDRLPRLISAQAAGCCPLNRAIESGMPWEPMEENTLADSIAVGVPRNAEKALMAIRESGGLTVNVTDEEIMAAQQLLGRTCGVFGEPAGVTGTAGVKKLCEAGKIGRDDTVVSVVTGNGLKDVANAIAACGDPITIPSDMNRLLAAFAEKGIQAEGV
ncbi:MAG: pyridoxal-phosphate dependent enzyme, partial [Oscillibacter sp.]|nr:pyridoxal-phosphate dependent enzyme [Oscillibacter sp.]